jgi:CxxC motif-containing protein
MTEVICIVCPKGCHLKVDETDDYRVTGAGCERGIAYGKKELTNPTRVITSTVRVEGAVTARLPVKTDRDIPKGKIFKAMALLDDVTVTSPVNIGDVIVPNILGLDANFVATRAL